MEDKHAAALELLRRTPPALLQQSLRHIAAAQPELIEDVLSDVDQPLKVKTCPKTQKDFLICEYNRDGDSYRSPWSNEYVPALPEGTVPSDNLRQLEIQANELFGSYREAYFEGGLSSVYFWDLDSGMACAVLIKKEIGAGEGGVQSGVWDSIHVVDVTQGKGALFKYKLTTTIILTLKTDGMEVSGSLTRQNEVETDVNDTHTHLVNIGNVIQDMENKLRNNVDQIYFGKAHEITSHLRSKRSLADQGKQMDLAQALKAQLAKRSG